MLCTPAFHTVHVRIQQTFDFCVVMFMLLCFGMHLVGVYGGYVKSPISLQCMAGSRTQASRNKKALSSSNNRQVKQNIKNIQWHCGKHILVIRILNCMFFMFERLGVEAFQHHL